MGIDAPVALQRDVVNEGPQERVQAGTTALQFENDAGVVDRRLNLPAVTDDLGVREQSLDVGRGEARDEFRSEAFEGLYVPRTSSKDGEPTQPRLRAFEGEQFEELGVVVERHAPLFVVVGAHLLTRSE